MVVCECEALVKKRGKRGGEFFGFSFWGVSIKRES